MDAGDRAAAGFLRHTRRRGVLRRLRCPARRLHPAGLGDRTRARRANRREYPRALQPGGTADGPGGADRGRIRKRRLLRGVVGQRRRYALAHRRHRHGAGGGRFAVFDLAGVRQADALRRPGRFGRRLPGADSGGNAGNCRARRRQSAFRELLLFGLGVDVGRCAVGLRALSHRRGLGYVQHRAELADREFDTSLAFRNRCRHGRPPERRRSDDGRRFCDRRLDRLRGCERRAGPERRCGLVVRSDGQSGAGKPVPAAPVRGRRRRRSRTARAARPGGVVGGRENGVQTPAVPRRPVGRFRNA